VSSREGIPGWEAEVRVFGASHAEVGAALLATWGLSPDIVEALALHHLPAQLVSRGFCPLTAVHVANAFHHSLGKEAPEQLDLHYLEGIGLKDRLPLWKEVCLEKLAQSNPAT